MCGRVTLTKESLDEVAHALFGAVVDPALRANYRPRWNVAPTDEHPILVAATPRQLVAASWGVRGVINARSERIEESRLFRPLVRAGRCIVPADGFYEWIASGKKKHPIWFHAPDGKLLLMAGLWGYHHRERHFAIITTAAGPDLEGVHDRMPCLLRPSDVASWLAGEIPIAALSPAPAGVLARRRVSTRVSSVANDDPACLDSPPEEGLVPDAPPKQLRLI